jgi:hypothetical protein
MRKQQKKTKRFIKKGSILHLHHPLRNQFWRAEVVSNWHRGKHCNSVTFCCEKKKYRLKHKVRCE